MRMQVVRVIVVAAVVLEVAVGVALAQGYHLMTLTPSTVPIGSNMYVYAEARNDGSVMWPFPQAWMLRCVNSWVPAWTNYYWQDNGWATQGETTTLYSTMSASLLPKQTGTFTITTTAYYKRMDSLYAFMDNTPIVRTLTMTPPTIPWTSRITRISTEQGMLSLTVTNMAPGRTTQVEKCSNLMLADWTSVTTVVLNVVYTNMDSVLGQADTSSFYRVLGR